MSDQQFDVSEKMQKLFATKQKLRQDAKAYFAKAMANPHRPIYDPPPFDPVFFRYASIQSYANEHYRANARNILGALLCFVGPVIALATYGYNFQKKREEILRGGEVAYKDRWFKTFY